MATDKGLEDVPEGTFDIFSTRFWERKSHAPAPRCCAGWASGLAPVTDHPARLRTLLSTKKKEHGR